MTEQEHDPVKKEESFREKSFHELHFVDVNDGAHDFDLTREALIGYWLVAVIYREGWGSAQEWRVSFFPQQKGSEECELSWETFQKITQMFAAFREEMELVASPKEIKPETEASQDSC